MLVVEDKVMEGVKLGRENKRSIEGEKRNFQISGKSDSENELFLSEEKDYLMKILKIFNRSIENIENI